MFYSSSLSSYRDVEEEEVKAPPPESPTPPPESEATASTVEAAEALTHIQENMQS